MYVKITYSILLRGNEKLLGLNWNVSFFIATSKSPKAVNCYYEKLRLLESIFPKDQETITILLKY